MDTKTLLLLAGAGFVYYLYLEGEKKKAEAANAHASFPVALPVPEGTLLAEARRKKRGKRKKQSKEETEITPLWDAPTEAVPATLVSTDSESQLRQLNIVLEQKMSKGNLQKVRNVLAKLKGADPYETYEEWLAVLAKDSMGQQIDQSREALCVEAPMGAGCQYYTLLLQVHQMARVELGLPPAEAVATGPVPLGHYGYLGY